MAAIHLYQLELLDLGNILHYCGFSMRTFYCILKLWHEMGDVVNPKTAVPGHNQLLDHDDVHYLLCLVADNPDYFLNELLHLLKTNWFISIHYTTLPSIVF